MKELLSVLETQEAALFSIASTDVSENAHEPLIRAKAGNKEALVKLTEVMEALKHVSLDSSAHQQQENPVPDLSLNQSISTLPLSPIIKTTDSSKTPHLVLQASRTFTHFLSPNTSGSALEEEYQSHQIVV